MNLQENLVPYLISNIISLILIFICYKYTKTGRIIFGIIFVLAGIFNIYEAFKSPDIYARVFGVTAVFPFYKKFIYGFFSSHASLIVSLIGGGQIAVGLMLFTTSLYKIGVIGGIIFLLAIAPLGVGSAFPSTVLMAVALFFIYQKSSR